MLSTYIDQNATVLPRDPLYTSFLQLSYSNRKGLVHSKGLFTLEAEMPCENILLLVYIKQIALMFTLHIVYFCIHCYVTPRIL